MSQIIVQDKMRTALIALTLQETKGLAELWSTSATLRAAVRGLTTFGRGLATVLIWLGIFCWAWVPPLVIWLEDAEGPRANFQSIPDRA